MISLLLASALSLSVGVPSSSVQPERDWTLLFYGASDNDSEQSFIPDMEQAMTGLPLAGVEVLAFVDRSPQHSDSDGAFGEDFADTRLYRLTRDGAERLSGGAAFPEITLEGSFEANSGDAETLRKALRWARETSPAKHYAVVFYSHGGLDSLCPDETSGGDMLFAAELTDKLTEQDSLDLMVFDVCEVGSIENAYQWRPASGKFGAEVMVATPMAGYPFPWELIFAGVAERGNSGEGLSPRDFGRLVVEGVEAGRLENRDEAGLREEARMMISLEAMACFDLTKADAVKRATDRLAGLLAKLEGAREELEDLRGSGDEIGLLNYLGPRPARAWGHSPYFDLFDLARRIPLLDCADESMLAAAKELESAVDDMVIASYGMSAYERYEFVPGASGLTILFPDSDQSWKNFSSYRPTRVQGKARAYGASAWCADVSGGKSSDVGNWYQLLNSWYGAH